MGRLIDSLLDFSRFNRAQLQAAAIDMQSLAAAVFEELAGGGERHVSLELASLPPARGDPAMLRQVWVNLLSNALKFSARREQALIQVGAARREGANLYWVRDNGAGFDMRYYDKLFQVFQRLHGEKEFEGSGIGLAIVQRVIQRHGGEVWAEGAPEQGAVFYFTLPEQA
jgi:light-regulated signal transduction histidine kinase (bacteriophytochrome)